MNKKYVIATDQKAADEAYARYGEDTVLDERKARIREKEWADAGMKAYEVK